MTLLDVKVSPYDGAIPPLVRQFIDEADRRIELFQQTSRIVGYVPSDFEGVYRLLRAILDQQLAPGTRFCEWGSGIGVIASLASSLGFDAVGIEIESDLVEASQKLADDFQLDVDFVEGTFLPDDAEPLLDKARLDLAAGMSWLELDTDDSLSDRDLSPDSFAIIYIYPWPDEQELIAKVFDRFAATETLLITNHGRDGLRVRRKKASSQAGHSGRRNRNPSRRRRDY